MGNSVCGQSPSQVWLLASSQLNGKSSVPYDPVIMKKMGQMELEFFNSFCQILFDFRTSTVNDFQEKCTNNLNTYYIPFLNEMYKYTGDENFNTNVKDEAANESNESDAEEDNMEGKPEELRIIENDIRLLDNVYGKKQCEYALTLINRTNEELEKNPETDAMKFMYDLYHSESDNLTKRLRMETIEEVNPVGGALNTWYNWSIL